MKIKIVFWSITVAMGGLLFGLDTAVISGAEQKIQQLWGLSANLHGFAIASALYGTILGAAFGNYPSDKIGRKKTLIIIGLCFFISAIGSALAPNVYAFIIFRILGGLSIGASSVVAPVYISEIAPSKHRGKMVMAFQINIVAGILIAYITNYFIGSMNIDNDWRWMLGIVAAPSLLFVLFLYYTPESPRWLILRKNNIEKAKIILAQSESNVDKAIKEIQDSAINDNFTKEKLFSKKYSFPLMLAFLIAFFNQFSGINAVIYYAPRIFEMTGLGRDSALLSTAGVGIVNLISTFIGWTLIDKFGRKTLMYIGSLGYIISLACISFAFYYQHFTIVPFFIYFFVLSHAIGQGAIIWVFISEIFPNSVRAKGMSWGCLIHWVFAALITQFFTQINELVGGAAVFSFFSFMMVLQLIFVWKLMPETKGVSLEDLQKKLIK